LGSTRMVTNESAIVVSRHDFAPFGQEVPSGVAGRTSLWATTDNINQKFTGQERDAESALDFFQARYMANSLARFMSPDPYNAGVDITNPQSWNAYAYVLGNPLNGTDPSGRDKIDCGNGNLADACVTDSSPDPVSTSSSPCSDFNEYCWAPPPAPWGGGGAPTFTVTGTGVADRNPSPVSTSPSVSTLPNNVARPDWLNNITSIFGYDQRITLPSCFGDFVNNTIGNLLPSLPGLSNVSEEGFGIASRVAYNRALSYAANTPSKTFGTSFLRYPFKSSVFRGLLSTSAILAEAAPMASIVTAEGQALFDEVQSMRQGACQ
jgi:RHS repeat-associated protein